MGKDEEEGRDHGTLAVEGCRQVVVFQVYKLPEVSNAGEIPPFFLDGKVKVPSELMSQNEWYSQCKVRYV